MPNESAFDQLAAYEDEKPFRDAMAEVGRELREQDAEINRLRDANATMLEALEEIEVMSGPTTAGRARKVAREAIAKAGQKEPK